tara:strand:+ start:1033 stop:2406 length:1374 start_codon:yes stop_codon:yes gene_type:complete
MFRKTNHIHFVGIGGIGMSGMAELLHKLQFSISGSDLNISERTNHLNKLNIEVFKGHKESNVSKADVVVFSSAVDKNNVELIAAKKLNIPIIRRAEMLSELLKLKPISIAISGTHGKTTSSSMLGSILTASDLEPTLVIGGIVNKFNTNAISGSGKIIVVEADEFDRSFLSLQPTMAVITNLDLEHLDCYKNLEDLQSAFSQFANSVPFYGTVAIYIDDTKSSSLISNIRRPIITFGISEDAYIRATNIKFNDKQSSFDLLINNVIKGNIILNVPGEHNIKNALAAISIAHDLEIPYKSIYNGLKQYLGVRRRFEIKWTTKNNIMIVDDYAHHPSEISATIQAAMNGWKRRLITIFQPHLYSRTRDFCDDFAKALNNSDILLITDIFGAREKPIPGVHSNKIINRVKELGHQNTTYIKNDDDIISIIKNISKANDIIITMGAGNIWRTGEKIFKALR